MITDIFCCSHSLVIVLVSLRRKTLQRSFTATCPTPASRAPSPTRKSLCAGADSRNSRRNWQRFAARTTRVGYHGDIHVSRTGYHGNNGHCKLPVTTIVLLLSQYGKRQLKSIRTWSFSLPYVTLLIFISTNIRGWVCRIASLSSPTSPYLGCLEDMVGLDRFITFVPDTCLE